MSNLLLSPGAATEVEWSSSTVDVVSLESADLATVAEIDSRLGECAGLWAAVVEQFETARRNLVLATAELQKTRRLAANQRRAKDENPDAPRPVVSVEAIEADEGRRAKLLVDFEAGLQQAEARRLALHGEMDLLRKRKADNLARLTPSLRATYNAAERAGRIPVIAALVNHTCSCCSAPVPTNESAAATKGSAVVCGGCGRLLILAEVK